MLAPSTGLKGLKNFLYICSALIPSIIFTSTRRRAPDRVLETTVSRLGFDDGAVSAERADISA